jgi:hypothetical protein
MFSTFSAPYSSPLFGVKFLEDYGFRVVLKPSLEARRMRSEAYLRKRRMTVTLEMRSGEARRMRSEAYLRKRRMTVTLEVRRVSGG